MSTLHTNSAPETVTRLLDMGLEPFNVSSALNLILAQRLVRRICSTCRTEVQTPPALRAMFRAGEPAMYFRGTGCHDCRGTGFHGRIGIFELLKMESNVSELVLTRAPEKRFHEIARANGMVSLREECLSLVARGETTLEEVLRVTHDWRPASPSSEMRSRDRD